MFSNLRRRSARVWGVFAWRFSHLSPQVQGPCFCWPLGLGTGQHFAALCSNSPMCKGHGRSRCKPRCLSKLEIRLCQNHLGLSESSGTATAFAAGGNFPSRVGRLHASDRLMSPTGPSGWKCYCGDVVGRSRGTDTRGGRGCPPWRGELCRGLRDIRGQKASGW